SKPELFAQGEELLEGGRGHNVTKYRRGRTARIREDVFRQPFFEDGRDQRDQQKTPSPKQKRFKPFGHEVLLSSTVSQPAGRIKDQARPSGHRKDFAQPFSCRELSVPHCVIM